jgi:hypothetical protein
MRSVGGAGFGGDRASIHCHIVGNQIFCGRFVKITTDLESVPAVKLRLAMHFTAAYSPHSQFDASPAFDQRV